MTSFLSFFGSILGNMFSMLTNSSIASLFGGLSLHWILLGFFILWTICQTFVFRGNISPGVSASQLKSGHDQEANDG